MPETHTAPKEAAMAAHMHNVFKKAAIAAHEQRRAVLFKLGGEWHKWALHVFASRNPPSDEEIARIAKQHLEKPLTDVPGYGPRKMNEVDNHIVDILHVSGKHLPTDEIGAKLNERGVGRHAEVSKHLVKLERTGLLNADRTNPRRIGYALNKDRVVV